ncbi:glutamate racemase [Halovulum dunhuangense]|uniref:Glutamate racemase n=1 Tax=Halovulum dunhuangense TaxID=1505036 RepID=A0A849L2Z1_9RHOB|nr:aspartate/glutamate racemase family protein [Halovulum dunhuangense]NNU80561.1 glutamate racemase [Halovulum dunhuangense]
MPAIGVFDSGLGGLTVLERLQAALPGQGFVYLGDNANAPYGTRSAGEILDLTMAGTQALFDRGCGLVILACNTASAVALRQMQEFWVPADRRVLGVFVPMIEAIVGRPFAQRGAPTQSAVSDVLLFATQATVASGAFSRELFLRASGVRVVEQACPGLVDALEAGDRAAADAIAAAHVRAALDRMPAPRVAALGCTHYPLAAGAFAAALPEGCRVLSQGDLVAAALCDYLRRHPRLAGGGGNAYLTSGDPQAVRRAAQVMTGRDLPFAPV